MIEFINLNTETPYSIFKQKYNEALQAGQKNIEAISISSYFEKNNEVDSRFVNLKFVDDNKFIFFSNYNSPKSIAFNSHSQISALFYWSSTNVQIRMKAKIKKTSNKYNLKYFKERSSEKNALAISSMQSEKIKSYNDVIRNYKKIKETKDLSKCPDYWGGFSFIPYYFEFWKGHDSRINKRECYIKINGDWKKDFLQP